LLRREEKGEERGEKGEEGWGDRRGDMLRIRIKIGT
jgi:hypothetical protein